MEEVNLYESSALREHTMPVIRPGGFELTANGLAHCRLAPDARVLDVGCGIGATVDYLRRRHGLATIGLDASALLLQDGTRPYGASPLMQARAEQLPAADGSFMLLGLEVRGEINPDLVRAMGGLVYGCGSGHGTCGTLTAGCCLLALYAGKGSTDETSSDRLMHMLQELNDWFSRHTGCASNDMSCDAIVGEAGPVASRQRCGTIVVETYGKVMEILTANGIDPMTI